MRPARQVRPFAAAWLHAIIVATNEGLGPRGAGPKRKRAVDAGSRAIRLRPAGSGFMTRTRGRPKGQRPDTVAGNGLIDRRALLGHGVLFAGTLGTGLGSASAAAEPLADDQWTLEPGSVVSAYQ